jgi:two-component system, sensor histidine kinase
MQPNWQEIIQGLEMENHRLKKELARTEERYHLLSEATNDTIWDWDLLSDQITWNEGFQTMFGYRSKDIEPGIESWYNRIHPEDRERVVSGIHRVIEHGSKRWSDEYRFRKADGSYAHILDRGYALHDENGQPYRMVGSMLDLTKRKEIENELARREQQLALITDSLPVLISYVDREERYQFANLTYESWFNRKREEVLGRTLYEMAGQEAYDAIKDKIQQALNGQAVAYETRMNYATISPRYVAFNFIPHQVNGRTEGFYLMATDITERIHSELALRQLTLKLAATNEELRMANNQVIASNEELSLVNVQLAKINTDLDMFVYAASHDLKSPVTSLDALLSRLEKRIKDKLDEKEKEILKMIQASAARLQKTIRELTQIAKIQRSTEEEKEKVYLPEVYDEIREELAGIIEESEVNFSVSLATENIIFARKHIRSILYNLISNALKYRSPARSLSVRITTTAGADKVILTVSDNGLGLTATQLENMFTMFKRFHSHVEGSGVGLYMIRRIVQNNGGTIEVESKPDVGTTFRIVLPQ